MINLPVSMRVSSKEDPDVCSMIIINSLKVQFGVRRPGLECSGQLALYKLFAEQFWAPIR